MKDYLRQAVKFLQLLLLFILLGCASVGTAVNTVGNELIKASNKDTTFTGTVTRFAGGMLIQTAKPLLRWNNQESSRVSVELAHLDGVQPAKPAGSRPRFFSDQLVSSMTRHQPG